MLLLKYSRQLFLDESGTFWLFLHEEWLADLRMPALRGEVNDAYTAAESQFLFCHSFIFFNMHPPF